MAKHQFGIMNQAPLRGQRYDSYTPEKYKLISIDDDFISPLVPKLSCVDTFWHSIDVPGKGLAYCGVTLISPKSIYTIIKMIEKKPERYRLKELLSEAFAENKFVIHYGL